MKVILLKSVPKVGKKDEVVDISQGYAQNALFPKKLAILATPHALEVLKNKKQNIVDEKTMKHSLLDKTIRDLNGQNLQMKVKSNDMGSLFSKIHEAEITKFLLEMHRISIDEKCLFIPDSPIRKLGSYEIELKEDDYSSKFIIEVVKA